jgi:S-adenosylmethionine hydrolase
MPPLSNPAIAIMSDFGDSDWFVGVMKGVVLSICPEIRLVDLCHDVGKQRVDEAAFILRTTYRYFPEGTIFLCVVDPEVGTSRLPIIARDGRYVFVAPNNGLLTHAAALSEKWEVRAIENLKLRSDFVSETFHGRDIFAPAAAHYAMGVPFEEFGPSVETMVRLPAEENVRREDRLLMGRVLYIDHFGNLLTNVEPNMLPEGAPLSSYKMSLKGRTVHGISPHFAAVPLNHPLMYWGSSGVLEVAINRASAALKWSVQLGEWFELSW